MLTVFTTGKMVEYVANRDFSLNFEDKSLKSVKVRTGSVLSYDGVMAELMQGTAKVTGRCPSLKAAISKLNWLVPKNGEPITDMFSEPAKAPVPQSDYNPKTGGNFDTYMNKNGMNGEKRGKMAIQRQEDQIVKTLPEKKTPPQPEPEIIPEQSIPREKLTVGSSTSVPRTQTHSAKVIQSENAGAQSSIPLKGTGRKVVATEDRPRKTFTVDATTPGVPEDSTMADVRRATTVINVDGASSQNSRVVKKIGEKAPVTEVEGVTMRKTVSRETPITAKASSANKELDVKVTITPGESVADLQGESTVVKTILTDTEKLDAAKKSADAKKAARLAKQPKTAKTPEKATPVPETTPQFNSLTGGSFDAMMAVEGLNGKEASGKKQDFMAMLPENWGDMHWVQKEKFIMAQTDKGFINFIHTVESTPAVVKACEERLKQLDKKSAAG